MRLLKSGLSLALALSAWTSLSAAQYNIDPAHSEIIFKVKHLGISTVTGHFLKFAGTFDVDAKNVKATKGNATIEASSINTGMDKRDEHLKSPDFFDVAKFPDLKYVSKEVRKVSEKDSTCELVGDLTMHGVTKEIILTVKGGGIAIDPWGNERAAFSATGHVNRKDFGLVWSKTMDNGSLVVSENVDIVLSFEGMRTLPPAPAKK